MTNHLAQQEKYYLDSLYQLTRTDYGNGDVHQWAYDDIGNRVQQTVTPSGQPPVVTTYTYYQNPQGRNSQLLQSDGASTYAFDNNGNLLTKGSYSYAWDYDDRLVGISGPSLSASYVYDYEGKRIKRTVGGVQTASLYQAEDIVKETSGATVTSYLHGTGIDDPVLLDRGGAKSYYYSDGLGSVREMADSGGTVQNSYAYGAWGEVRAQSVTIPNIYGYTGREFAEDGLYYYRARYMDPRLGRFTQEDPFSLYILIIYKDSIQSKYGLHKYIYAKNDTINNNDPYGLFSADATRYLCAATIMRHYYSKMRKKNWIGADGYYHCMGSCIASKICGPDASYNLGLLRELSDWARGRGFGADDMRHNARGITCPANMSCHERCKSLAPTGMPFD